MDDFVLRFPVVRMLQIAIFLFISVRRIGFDRGADWEGCEELFYTVTR
jgi:hypothetical protein